jgi:DNA invertase Pin-like site-specific DNA recombinase
VRLVGYVRVSSETQIEGYGLDVQERSIRAWARAHNHRLIDVLRDEGVSGAKEAADRPGLSAALVYFAHPRRADGLVVPRLDRLARALTIQEATLGLIWREGGHVFTADAGEVLRDDPDDPMRTALRQVVGVFAELDRRMTVKRMKDGRKAKAATGKHAVGQYAFGYHGEGKGRDRDAGPKRAATDYPEASRLTGIGEPRRRSWLPPYKHRAQRTHPLGPIHVLARVSCRSVGSGTQRARTLTDARAPRRTRAADASPLRGSGWRDRPVGPPGPGGLRRDGSTRTGG